MKASRQYIPAGDAGVEQTLRTMRRLVLASAEDPIVIGWAQDVVRFTPERDPDAVAQAFLSWVRANFRYTDDPVEVESVKTPEAMVREFRAKHRVVGDCDDQVTMLAAGLNAVGIDTEFVVIAADPNYPNDFSHVLMRYMGKSGWTSADPIVRGTSLGWFPPTYTRSGRLAGGRLGPIGGQANLFGDKCPDGERFLFGVIVIAMAAHFMMKPRRSRR